MEYSYRNNQTYRDYKIKQANKRPSTITLILTLGIELAAVAVFVLGFTVTANIIL